MPRSMVDLDEELDSESSEMQRDHWFVILSANEFCADPRELLVNGLACFTFREIRPRSKCASTRPMVLPPIPFVTATSFTSSTSRVAFQLGQCELGTATVDQGKAQRGFQTLIRPRSSPPLSRLRATNCKSGSAFSSSRSKPYSPAFSSALSRCRRKQTNSETSSRIEQIHRSAGEHVGIATKRELSFLVVF